MRQHPIALGRGAKWWREQVRRNVSAIFDGLVRKGAKADRATMSRSYAFAIGSLVKHGYLKRTDKGLMVTEKGLAKSREKLRTVGARKKHEHFEKQLALVRKGPARRPANKRKTRRNPPEGVIAPARSIAKSVAENEYGPLPARVPPTIIAKAKKAGWTDEELAGMDNAQIFVVADPRLSEIARRRSLAATAGLIEGTRRLAEEARRPRLPAFLTAPVGLEPESTLTPLGEALRAQFGGDEEMRRAFRLLSPEEQEAIETERSIRRGIARDVRARRETYVYRMGEEMGPSGKVWFLIAPQITNRTGAQTKIQRMVNGVRLLRQRQIIEPDLRAKIPDYDAYLPAMQIDAIKKYYKQYRAKVDDARQDEDGRSYTQVSAARLDLGEMMYGLALAALQNSRWPTEEEILDQMDEAKRLFLVIHTRGGSTTKSPIPGGWDFVWRNSDAPYETVYKTTSLAAGMNAIQQLSPQMVGIVNVLPTDVMRTLFVRSGAMIGERAEGERQRRIAKKAASVARRRAQAEVMQAMGVREFRMLDPEEQRALGLAQMRRGEPESDEPREPRTRPPVGGAVRAEGEELAERLRRRVPVGMPVPPSPVPPPVTPPQPARQRRPSVGTAPSPEDPSNLSVDELWERLTRKNRRNRRR